jgi:predicted Zn finger-like uncharacterized protein
MQIVCPNCATAYEIKPGALGDAGRSVRCARCRTTWFAEPAAGEPALAAPVRAAESEPAGKTPPQPTATATEEVADNNTFDWSFSAEDTEAPGGTPSRGQADDDEPPAGSALGQDDVDALFGPSTAAPVEDTEAPPLVPALEPEDFAPDSSVTAAEPDHPELANIESVAARRTPARKKARKLGLPSALKRPGASVLIAAFAGALVAVLFFRVEVVRVAPQTASLFAAVGLPVNLRGIEFQNVRTTGEVHEGVPVLIVEGSIANVTNRTVEVPRLRFALRSRAGHEVYAWTTVTGRSTLGPGESAAFRTRLASPPSEGRDVVVRFFNRRDLLAGMR